MKMLNIKHLLTANLRPQLSFPQQPQQSLFFKPKKTRAGKIICHPKPTPDSITQTNTKQKCPVEDRLISVQCTGCSSKHLGIWNILLFGKGQSEEMQIIQTDQFQQVYHSVRGY